MKTFLNKYLVRVLFKKGITNKKKTEKKDTGRKDIEQFSKNSF